jgi:hypothetical protein
MPADAQARVITAATQYVGYQMKPEDLAAILSKDGARVKVIEDFTGDHDRLANAIQHLSGDSRETPSPGKQLDGLRTATEMLGSLPGKKAVLYFFAGSPNPATDLDQLRAAVDAAVRANVAFFPIDSSGSIAFTPYVIAAGDTLSISISGDPRFDGTYTVRPDGMISIPVTGEIKAAGLTPSQLQHAIDQALLPHLKTPRSHVNVIAVHSKPSGN